jgi:hypothetical protein
MAWPGEPAKGDSLLAGRFTDDEAPAAVELFTRAGGEVVADIDEARTGLESRPLNLD